MWDPQLLTTLEASTACYGDNFIFLHVDDVRTSQETDYGPTRPVTGMALLFICMWYSYLTGNMLMGLHGVLRELIHFLHIDDVRTSQKVHLCISKVCYGDDFTFLYTDYVPTSQKLHVWAYITCYRDIFTFLYVDDVRTIQETHL
jgi:hypothetical protein